MVDRSVNNYKVGYTESMVDCSVNNYKVGYTDNYNGHG